MDIDKFRKEYLNEIITNGGAIPERLVDDINNAIKNHEQAYGAIIMARLSEDYSEDSFGKPNTASITENGKTLTSAVISDLDMAEANIKNTARKLLIAINIACSGAVS